MKKDEMRLERLLPGPIERVWDHLTRPENVKRWLANDISLEGKVGGEVTLELEDGAVVTGTVTRYEPPHAIAYTWDDGHVSFELVPRGPNVLLVLTLTKRLLGGRSDLARMAA
jgi:uncharacterized protein YndB with AHSA1/START domain